MEMLVCFMVSLPLWSRLNISTTIRWFGTKLVPGIRGSQMMNPSDFGDPLQQTMRLIFVVLSEMSVKCGWIAINFSSHSCLP